MTESPKGIKEVPTEFNIPPYKPLTKEKVLQDVAIHSLKEELIDLLNQVEHAIEEIRCLISECKGSCVEKMSEKLDRGQMLSDIDKMRNDLENSFKHPKLKEDAIMDTGLSAAKDKLIDILCQPEYAKELKRITKARFDDAQSRNDIENFNREE